MNEWLANLRRAVDEDTAGFQPEVLTAGRRQISRQDTVPTAEVENALAWLWV